MGDLTRSKSILVLMLVAILLVVGAAGGASDVDSMRVVHASEILSKIENGEPVEYYHVIIVGSLDFSQLELPKNDEGYFIVTSPINIRNSNIQEFVNCNNTIFQKPVVFWRTKFNRDVHFTLAQFNGESAYFGDAQFDKTANFEAAKFCGNANFENVSFSEDTNFAFVNYSGDACFEGARFTGDADFFLNRVRGYANLWYAQFDGDASFCNSQFEGGAGFKDAKFGGNARFGNANFHDVRFDGAQFIGDAEFYGAEFGNANFGPSYFQRTTVMSIPVYFKSHADFRRTRFNSAFFPDAYFNDDADFGESNFTGDAIFWATNFSGDANFTIAQFNGKDSFWRARFQKNSWFTRANFTGEYANFKDVQFSGDADFGGAQFNGKYANFTKANFAKAVSFYRAQFNGPVIFKYARFGPVNFIRAPFSQLADFYGAQFNGLATFTEVQFDRDLNFTKTKFSVLEIEWDSIKDHLICDGPTYLALIKNFNELEQFEDADNCYFQYRWWRQGTKSWLSLSKLFDVIALLSCGYGVRPRYTIYCSLAIIFLFGVLFWAGNAIVKSSSPYQESYASGYQKKRFRKAIFKICQKLRRSLGQKPSISIPVEFYFSVLVFLHTWQPHNMRTAGRWKYIVLFEDILGWLLLALFIVTLANVMIR